ncbi:hypothetical protein DB345_19040 [Spartobacteria bacterium LR76]|nr:hypothetical protein DB345_19040 [Spartobacteria bacterium LR76]
MTLLLTSDLLGKQHWYEWLVRCAPRVDAICVAGDLVDPWLGDIDAQRDAAEFAAWRIGRQRTGFYACEGDQDLLGPRWHWLKSQSGTRCHGEVAITSLPWRSQNKRWLEQPDCWRRETGSAWLVVGHEPPAGNAVGAGPGAVLQESSAALSCQPDFLLTGHMRSAPWESDGCWWSQSGGTVVFNAGYDPDGDFPCHILLNAAKREAVWRHPRGHDCIRLDAFSRPHFSTTPQHP